MGHYHVDERDLEFNLFEQHKITDLLGFERYKDFNEDLFKMVVTEGVKFAKNELDPIWASGDREGCQFNNGEVKAPKGYKECFKKIAENGFLAVDIPTTYGGQGLPIMLNSAIYEVFTGSNTSMTLYFGLTRGSSFLIESFGTKELAEKFCAKMYAGEWGGTMCLTEPQAGTAVGDLKTTAKENGDGTYSIVGNKIFITSGEHDLTDNIIHLVLARVEGDAPGTKGISLFVVPKLWVNDDGSLGDKNDVSCVNIEHKMGIHASPTCSLNFGENGKCRGYLVGEQGKGMKYMFQMMNEARLLCGVQGQATAATAYENAVRYSKERIQGNNTHIIDYPDVRRGLGLCRSWVEGMRSLLIYTGRQLDIAEYHADEDARKHAQNRSDLLTPICKAYCSDFGFKVTEIALQLYGGYGYVSEYPMEQYMRDVKIASIYEGANGIQALDLMGRKLALNNGELFREFYEDLSAFAGNHEAHEVLAEQVGAFKKAVDTVGQVAMKFAEWGMGGDRQRPMMGATPFLEMVGHATLGYLLIEQAVIAHDKIKNGQDDAFLRDKIRTAKFFVAHTLPLVQMRAKEILSGDLSAMEMEF